LANSNLKQLLIEYDKKRDEAIRQAEKRKQSLYSQIPRLEEIDSEISLLTIRTSKTLLMQKDNSLLKDLNKKIDLLRKEKQNLLKKNQIEENFFLPQYECMNCKDTGYLENSNYISSMCNCLKQKLFNIEYNKSNIYNLASQNFDNFKINYYSDKADPDKYHSDLSPRENIKLIYDISQKFLENFENPNEKNLLFTGNTGLGKTFLSSCIANELIKKGKTVLYQTAPVMLDEIINYRFCKDSSQNDFYEHLLNVDLLIIDDLGTECMNQMKFTELFNVLNTRLLNQSNKVTKTIISTNLSLQNLYSNYDERIVSRLVGYYDICYFFGDDIRFKIR